jgi:hypothetical protein
VSEVLTSCFRSAAGRAAVYAAIVLGIVLLPAHTVWAQKINVEFDQGADFSRYHTFAIRDGELNSKNPELNNELTRKNIETDIERALTAKGLTRVEQKPDLNVRYTLGSARRVEAEAYPAGWYGMGTRIVRVPFAEGTLVIDLRDPTTRSLVWRGIATDSQQDPAKLGGKLGDMVKKSLAKYPPKK